jgi:hypothetical protein
VGRKVKGCERWVTEPPRCECIRWLPSIGMGQIERSCPTEQKSSNHHLARSIGRSNGRRGVCATRKRTSQGFSLRERAVTVVLAQNPRLATAPILNGARRTDLAGVPVNGNRYSPHRRLERVGQKKPLRLDTYVGAAASNPSTSTPAISYVPAHTKLPFHLRVDRTWGIAHENRGKGIGNTKRIRNEGAAGNQRDRGTIKPRKQMAKG